MEKTNAEHTWVPFGRKRAAVDWIDVVWLVFILGLALLPPIHEIHKQLLLLALGVFQFLEGSFIARYPRAGRYAAVAIKIVLATVLLDHTSDIGINSSYGNLFRSARDTGLDRARWGRLLLISDSGQRRIRDQRREL